MMAATKLREIIFTCVLALCIIHCFAAPPGKSMWDSEKSPVDSRSDEDSNELWDDDSSFDLDDDSPLNPIPDLSQKAWYDNDLTSHLEDMDDTNDDDNHIDESDESNESDDNGQEEELVIEGIDEEDHTDKSKTTKDLVDDTLKLRHGGHGRLEDDDSDDDDDLSEEEGNLQSLDEISDDTKQGEVLLRSYNMAPYSNGDDESDENDLDDDDDIDDGESDEDIDDESNSVFADQDDKEQKIFEDHVLMF